MESYGIFAITMLTTYLVLPLFRSCALRYHVLDVPGGRKVHKEPTPLLGGCGVAVGCMVGVAFCWREMVSFAPLFIAGMVILITGLVDDVRKLSAHTRIFFQFIAALIIVGAGIRINFLANSGWGYFIEVTITMTWIIGVTNAYNYLDGVDGLAAGSAVINMLFFAGILYKTGQYGVGVLAIIVAAACMGFIPYNFRKNKMFLGDAGSTFLGFMNASISLVGSWAGDNIVKISVPVLILGVPIFDMVFTTFMRIKEDKIHTIGEWLRYGGRDHFHHYLVDLGLTSLGTVLFVYSVTIILGMSAVMVKNDHAIEAYFALAQAFIIFVIIGILIVAGKRHQRREMREKADA